LRKLKLKSPSTGHPLPTTYTTHTWTYGERYVNRKSEGAPYFIPTFTLVKADARAEKRDKQDSGEGCYGDPCGASGNGPGER